MLDLIYCEHLRFKVMQARSTNRATWEIERNALVRRERARGPQVSKVLRVLRLALHRFLRGKRVALQA